MGSQHEGKDDTKNNNTNEKVASSIWAKAALLRSPRRVPPRRCGLTELVGEPEPFSLECVSMLAAIGEKQWGTGTGFCEGDTETPGCYETQLYSISESVFTDVWNLIVLLCTSHVREMSQRPG